MVGVAVCPGWEHAGNDVVAEPGHITCAQHIQLEPRILKVRDDLARFAAEMRAYEAEPNRHPDEAKEFLETAVRWFFDQELDAFGLRCSPAFRSLATSRQQLDVVVALTVDGPNAWSVDMRVIRHAENARLAMHTEIAYRSGDSDVYEKVRSDAKRLVETIGHAQRRGEGLPWTSLVLLGNAWPKRTRQVMRRVHDVTAHTGDVNRIELAGHAWWPIIDAVVMPSVVYKKHDLFESSDAAIRRASTDTRTPCWMAFPTDVSDPFRSLAIARAYLVHRVRLLQEGVNVSEDEAPWRLEEAPAIVGPIQALRGHPELFHAYLARDRSEQSRLWHAGYDRARDEGRTMPFDPVVDAEGCENGSKFQLGLGT